ncbi:hypothetical protein M011DRAFT_314859 [Sporormia fimetaria CBS 119925]|uniref:Uncharacterized protein n=1 Tax=Sporormia fimetaria CBS 119925 TaxID=1340428 RepID=A0A6A6UVL4_9PLEO|nr:hypothetical protein M011DRAFT_314859 [Sporormia fimetaria CBS 119925]
MATSHLTGNIPPDHRDPMHPHHTGDLENQIDIFEALSLKDRNGFHPRIWVILGAVAFSASLCLGMIAGLNAPVSDANPSSHPVPIVSGDLDYSMANRSCKEAGFFSSKEACQEACATSEPPRASFLYCGNKETPDQQGRWGCYQCQTPLAPASTVPFEAPIPANTLA